LIADLMAKCIIENLVSIQIDHDAGQL